MHQALDRSVDGEARGWERRLAEAVDTTQRRLDDLDSRCNVVRAALSAAEDRISETARAGEAELKETESYMRRQVADLQTMLAGKISQSDFELRAILRTSLAEQTEGLRAELAQVEQGASAERALIRGVAEDKAKELEARLLKWREDMDRQLKSAEDSAVRRQTQTVEACSQLRADLTEYNREARAYSDRLAQDTRAAIDIAVGEVREESMRRGQRHERLYADLAKETTSLEERLSSSIALLDLKASTRLTEELSLERERTREDMQRLLEEERSIRVRAETERLSSLQKRLGAHEELTTRRLDELRGRQDDAMLTHKQQIEAKLLQDRQDARHQIEEGLRELREADTNVKADLARLGERCRWIEEELPGIDERVSERLEERCDEFRQRVDAELAAFSAKLAVSLATLGAELRQGLGSMDSKLQESLSSLRADLHTVGAAGDANRDELREKLESSTFDLGERLDTLSTSLVARATSLDGRLDGLHEAIDGASDRLQEQSSQMSQALQGLKEHVEDTLRAAQEAMRSDSGQLAERLGEIQDNIHGVEEEVFRRLKELEDLQESHGLKEDGLLGGLQQQLGELASRMEAHRSSDAGALAEVKAALDMSLQEASSSFSSSLQAANEDIQATVAALEEKLLADVYEGEERRIALSNRMDDLEEDLRKEQDRAQAGEDDLKSVIQQQKEDIQTKLQESEKALTHRTHDAIDRLSTQIETLRGEQDIALHNLETQTQEAESDVRQTLQEQQVAIADKLQEFATQQDKRFGDVASDFGERIEEFRSEQKSRLEVIASQLRELQGDQQSAVGAEVARAKQAEAELMKIAEISSSEDKKLIRAVEDRCDAVAAELRRQLDEVNQSQAAHRATQEERCRQLEEQQLKQAEIGASDLQGQLEALKQQQQQALHKEEARAKVAEDELAQRMDLHSKTLESTRAEVQEQLKDIQAAQQEAAEQSVGELRSKLESLRNEQEEVATAIRAQVHAAEITHEKAHAALEAQVQNAAENGAKTSQEQVRQQSDVIDELKRRLDVAERHGGELAKETKDLRELHGHWHAEQAKFNNEVETRQDAVGDDIELLGQKLQELAVQTEASADAQELQQSIRADIAQLQERLESIDGDSQAGRSGLEDQMGALVQTAAELMGKVDRCASKEALHHLSAHLDGSLDALAVRFETERWVRESCDRVADNVANQFLRLLDEASSKMEHRMEDCEKRLAIADG